MSNVFDSMISKNGDQPQSTNSQTPNDDSTRSAPQPPVPSQPQSSSHSPTTPHEVRATVQDLLRDGYIEETRKSESFRRTIVYQKAINVALEPLDLALQLDEHRGVAFLKVATSGNAEPPNDQGWSHPLVRRQRLTLEQSLLVAILRQAFVVHEQEAGVGQCLAKIAVEDLLPQFLTYFDDTGSDAKNESRLLSLLDQLKTHGVVSEVDKKQEVTIGPMIAHLANPESLTALLNTLKQQAETGTQSEDATGVTPEGDSNE